MSSTPEQLAAATKAHFDAQFGLINALTSKAFEGMEKVIELNVDVTKASLEEASDTVRKTDTANASQEVFSAMAEKAHPNAEKALDYSRQLAVIAANMHVEFAKAAETQVAETTRALAALIDEAARNAPPGSENTIAMMKTLIGNVNAGYEELAKNAKQAVETLQASVKTATNQLTQVAEKMTQATQQSSND